MRVQDADATTNQYDRDPIGNKTDAAVVAVGTTKSIIAYVKGILSQVLVLLSLAGTTFTIKKTLVSSAIVQAGVDVTGASSVGALTITDIVLQTNGTGLAAGTNLTLETDNANGIAVFFSTAVSGLGANKTINLDTASVTKIRTVLESGKKIIAKMTAADGTGAGTVDVYLTFRRHANGATIAAA